MATFRLATPADLPALAQMRWDFRTEGRALPPPNSRPVFLAACTEFLQEAHDSGRWAFWVAEQNGEIVAHAFVQRVRKVPNPNRLHDEIGYLTNVYTRPEMRNQGIGEGLLKRVLAWAGEQDLELLLVWPSERSRGLYERLGFAASEALERELRTYQD